MTRHIHGIVEKSQDLDYLPVFIATYPKHYEMTPFTTMACGMQHK